MKKGALIIDKALLIVIYAAVRTFPGYLPTMTFNETVPQRTI